MHIYNIRGCRDALVLLFAVIRLKARLRRSKTQGNIFFCLDDNLWYRKPLNEKKNTHATPKMRLFGMWPSLLKSADTRKPMRAILESGEQGSSPFKIGVSFSFIHQDLFRVVH